jgi:pilus assembly protein CpaB
MSAKAETLVGRGVVAPLFSGEPVIESRLAPVGSGGGLASTIPPGMRACAVKVNDVVGVAGFVTPGMRVDVLIASTGGGGVFGVNGGNTGTKVKTLLQNLEVLSAGTDIQRDLQGKPSQVQVVNLLVTPEQAEVLSLANAEARIQLVLRNPMDTRITQTSGAQLSRLFADEVAPPPAVSAPVAVAPRVRRDFPAPPPAPAAVAAQPEPTPTPAAASVEVIYGAKRANAEGGK